MKEAHSPDKPKPPSARARWLTRLMIALYAVALIAFAGLIFSRKGEIVTRNSQYEITHITIVTPAVRTAGVTAAWLGALALFSAGIAAICRRRTRLGVITILIALCGCPASGIVSFCLNPAPWTIEDEIIGPDAHAYCFLDSSFLQGQTMAMARLDSKGALRRTFKVLGTNNGDSPRSWASVIRPVGVSTDRVRQLHVGKSRMVLGFCAHECFLAYDPDSGRFYGHGDVEELSPFILLGSETAMHQPDVAAVMERVRWYADFVATEKDIRHAANYLAGDTSPGYPRPETLTAGLSHANPAVRSVAKDLLDINRAGIMKATERVGKACRSLIGNLGSEDSSVRCRAAAALGGIGGPGAEPAISALTQAVRDEDADVRLQAAQSLGLIGQKAVPTLLQLLKDEDDSVREYALFGLNMAGPAAKAAIPALVEMLKGKDPRFRVSAVKALGNIGPEAATAIPMLEEVLQDEVSSVRLSAAKAIEKMRR